MTLLVSPPAAWAIAAGATLAAGALAFLEWRRADRRQRLARVAASVLAVGALGVLGVRPASRVPAPQSPSKEEVVLWTRPDADSVEPVPPGEPDAALSALLARVGSERTFALPGAGRAAPGGAAAVPDAAFLRRRFPELGTLHVLGGGLEPWDLAALRGVRVVFHPTPPADGAAAVRFLRVPREVPLGGSVSVQGRVGPLPAGGSATLTLLGPDSTAEGSVTVTAADGERAAAFTLTGAPTRAVGEFAWKLRLEAGGSRAAADEAELGVAVIAPELPRTLILESAPRFDTAPLRRWLAGAGGMVTTRSLVGQDRSRYASANGAPGEFTALDTALLARFDVVVADAPALASLPPAEGVALRAAVTDGGLGVLVLGDGGAAAAVVGAGGRSGDDDAFFSPWELEKTGGAAGGEDSRSVRPTWAGWTRPTAMNLPAEPFAIHVPPEARTLVRDGQGRTLAAAGRRGRGQVALTLVRETRRWQQAGEPQAFAAYWSFLLSEVARRTEGTGRWSLAGGAESGPAFVNEPVELRWTGPGTPTPGMVVEAAEGGAEDAAVPLPLAQDAAEPTCWRGTFWPRRSGWHRVRAAREGVPGMDFYVHAEAAWPGLRAERRRMATTQAAALGPPDGFTDGGNRGPRPDEPVSLGWVFITFAAAAIYLWVERRVSSPTRI